MKLFWGITGTHFSPKATTDLSIRIFRAMIIPVITYAPTILVLLRDKDFDNLDVWLRKAARMALHAPPSTRNSYIEYTSSLVKSKNLIMTLAHNYLSDENRTAAIKNILDRAQHSPLLTKINMR